MNFNNINNDIDWYAGNQIRDNVLHDSPLFPRQISNILIFFINLFISKIIFLIFI